MITAYFLQQDAQKDHDSTGNLFERHQLTEKEERQNGAEYRFQRVEKADALRCDLFLGNGLGDIAIGTGNKSQAKDADPAHGIHGKPHFPEDHGGNQAIK